MNDDFLCFLAIQGSGDSSPERRIVEKFAFLLTPSRLKLPDRGAFWSRHNERYLSHSPGTTLSLKCSFDEAIEGVRGQVPMACPLIGYDASAAHELLEAACENARVEPPLFGPIVDGRTVVASFVEAGFPHELDEQFAEAAGQDMPCVHGRVGIDASAMMKWMFSTPLTDRITGVERVVGDDMRILLDGGEQ